jgi:diguanylate cyclase (GGDEF)-like protein
MWRKRASAGTTDLAPLVEACEAGRDLGAILAIACQTLEDALPATAASAYTLSEDAAWFDRVCGDGPDQLPAADTAEPWRADGRLHLPLVSARRVLGCLTVTGAAGDIPAARLVAAIAAQAVEINRLWETAGPGAGTSDLLTGLPNHRGFAERAARELARAHRTGSVVAVAVVDLDGFAAFNEVNGHAAGDRLLRTAASCFAGGVRSYDVVCRLGGDEFGLVLAGMEAPAAAALLSRLVEAFSTSTDGATVSGGVAAFPSDGATLVELERLATGSLYWAQRGGGGQVVAYDPAVVEALTPRERADQLERDTYDRTMRALEATGGRSTTARAVSDYAGFLAAELGMTPDRADRLRLAAFVYDTTTPGGDPPERARLASRVAANALDAEAAEWLLAAPSADAPLESQVIAVSAAFVELGGHTGSAGAGRALAALWKRAGVDVDARVVRALESLLADDVADAISG